MFDDVTYSTNRMFDDFMYLMTVRARIDFPCQGPVPDQTNGTAGVAGRGESVPKGKDGIVIFTYRKVLTSLKAG